MRLDYSSTFEWGNGVLSMADTIQTSAIVTKVARRDLESSLRRRGAGIRAIEHGVLRGLEGEGHTLASLGRAMMISPSSLLPVVDALESRGLLRRGKDPKDRRRLPLSLTREGEEMLAHTPAIDSDSILVEALESMSEERREQLLVSLRSFVSHLTDEPGSPGDGFEVKKAHRELR